MKTLSAQADQARQRRWAEIIYLLELTLWRDKFGASPTSKTIYLSDRARSEIGQEWLPIVRDWGDIGDALAPTNVNASIGALDVELSNQTPVGGKARFTDLIRHGLNAADDVYDIAFADAKLHLLFKGGAAGDEEMLFRLIVEEPADVTEEKLTLRMSGVELALEDTDKLYRISTADFPRADPDWVGAAVPLLGGRHKNLRMIPVVAGYMDTLRTDMTASIGIIELSSSDIVAALSVNGKVQIENEVMLYGSKDVAGARLLNLTRAQEGTTAAAHRAGAKLLEILTEYVYLVGENPSAAIHKNKTVADVYWDGAKRVLGTNYSATLDDGALVSGRRFTVVKIFRPSTPTPPNELTLQTTTILPATLRWTTPSAAPTLLLNWPSLPVGFIVTKARYVVEFTHACFLSGTSGANTFFFHQVGSISVFVNPLVEWSPGCIVVKLFNPNSFEISNYDLQTVISANVTGPVGGGIDVELTVISAQVIVQGSAPPQVPFLAKSNVVTDPKSAASAIFGVVTADVDGLQDDGSGTISGTPNLLLENPADLTKLFLREAYGEKTPGNYDAGSWADTRTQLAQRGYKWAVRFDGLTFSEFRRRVGLQSRAELFQESGLWILRWRDIPAPVLTLDSRLGIGADGVRFGFTPRTEIVTRLTVLSAWDDGRGVWGRSLSYESAVYTVRLGSKVGRKREGRQLELIWIIDAVTANDAAKYWLEQWERPRLTAEITLPWEALIVEKGDAVALDFPMLKTFGGTQVRFAVRSKRYQLETDLIVLTAVEAGILPMQLLGTYRVSVSQSIAKTGKYGVQTAISPIVLNGRYDVNPTRAFSLSGAYEVGLSPRIILSGRYRVPFTPAPTKKEGVYAVAGDTGHFAYVVPDTQVRTLGGPMRTVFRFGETPGTGKFLYLMDGLPTRGLSR